MTKRIYLDWNCNRPVNLVSLRDQFDRLINEHGTDVDLVLDAGRNSIQAHIEVTEKRN